MLILLLVCALKAKSFEKKRLDSAIKEKKVVKRYNKLKAINDKELLTSEDSEFKYSLAAYEAS